MNNVLLIDNFDSFTFNLVHEFEKLECNVLVYRNNVDLPKIKSIIQEFNPKLLVISPGPSSPENAGNSVEIIKEFCKTIPVFGVCLGHQCIIEAFNGKVGKADKIVHGKPSKIIHNGKGIFESLENPLHAGRYHSLIAREIPGCFEITARTGDGIPMAVQHKEYNVIGVQFHPESILTSEGKKIIENLLRGLQ